MGEDCISLNTTRYCCCLTVSPDIFLFWFPGFMLLFSPLLLLSEIFVLHHLLSLPLCLSVCLTVSSSFTNISVDSALITPVLLPYRDYVTLAIISYQLFRNCRQFFLCFKKAFDLVDHSVLLAKLSLYIKHSSALAFSFLSDKQDTMCFS